MPRDTRDAEYANDAEYASMPGMLGMLRSARDAEYAKDAKYASMSGIPGIQGCLGMPRMSCCMPRM